MTLPKEKLYLKRFRNKVFVLKIGGEVVAQKKTLEHFLKDIKVLFAHGIQVVLVHGGGPQADEWSAKIGHTPTKINGRRVTHEKDLEIAKMIYGGSLNIEILSLMKKLNMKGIRVCGLDGDLLEVKLRDKKAFDFGYVGDIDSVRPQVLHDVLEKGYIPVVSPLACTTEGVIVNINADTIATEIASTMKAEKLFFFTSVDGVYSGKKQLNMLTSEKALQLIETGVAKDGMAVKLHNCLQAIERGVKRVHILNGLSPHSLLMEVLTKKGVGTMIVSENEKSLYLNE